MVKDHARLSRRRSEVNLVILPEAPIPMYSTSETERRIMTTGQNLQAHLSYVRPGEDIPVAQKILIIS